MPATPENTDHIASVTGFNKVDAIPPTVVAAVEMPEDIAVPRPEANPSNFDQPAATSGPTVYIAPLRFSRPGSIRPMPAAPPKNQDPTLRASKLEKKPITALGCLITMSTNLPVKSTNTLKPDHAILPTMLSVFFILSLFLLNQDPSCYNLSSKKGSILSAAKSANASTRSSTKGVKVSMMDFISRIIL